MHQLRGAKNLCLKIMIVRGKEFTPSRHWTKRASPKSVEIKQASIAWSVRCCSKVSFMIHGFIETLFVLHKTCLHMYNN